MKDLLEPFLYPHNLILLGLVAACFYYRKKGLWFLLAFYYLTGNSLLANQVRHWYASHTASYSVAASNVVVVLGCGGSAQAAPACAKARLQQLAQLLPNGGSVIITTRYCKPYIDYLLTQATNVAIDCFYAGDNTYKEFNSLAAKSLRNADYILTSDFHAWRVKQLVNYYGFSSKVLAASSQTFRPVNCGLNCMLTVNLTNFDFYSKLTAEFASYLVFILTRDWTDWYDSKTS
jgi:hypothetical protein